MDKLSNSKSLEPGYTLVLFTEDNPNLLAQYSDLFRVYHCHDFAEWQKKRITPSAFIVDGKGPNYITSTLDQIRRDKEVFASLCYVSGPVTNLSNKLVDGQLPEPSLLQEKIHYFSDLEKSFKYHETDVTHVGRLIKYLWLRPDFILEPYHFWKESRFYSYPLLDALSYDELDSFEWLRSLANTKILELAVLTDRQRECANCRSSHLSFIDVCPNCHAIDIDMKSSLHCFTCGCVDTQEKFVHSGALVCPKCSTQLRHIGSDYDRPIENYICQGCHHLFAEPDVLVRCASCEKEMVPDDLISNKIYSWKLSDRGRMLAARGDEFDIASSFDQLDFISRELFVHDLDWLLVSSRRYPDITFSLFGIYFVNLPELVSQIGHTQVLQMLEAFAQRLRSMLRVPDLSTRSAENLVWLLLPFTNEEGLHGFQARIEANLNALQKDNELRLDVRFVGVSASQIHEREDAELLLARQRSELM